MLPAEDKESHSITRETLWHKSHEFPWIHVSTQLYYGYFPVRIYLDLKSCAILHSNTYFWAFAHSLNITYGKMAWAKNTIFLRGACSSCNLSIFYNDVLFFSQLLLFPSKLSGYTVTLSLEIRFSYILKTINTI